MHSLHVYTDCIYRLYIFDIFLKVYLNAKWEISTLKYIPRSELKLFAGKSFRSSSLLVLSNWITTTFVISYSDGDFLCRELHPFKASRMRWKILTNSKAWLIKCNVSGGECERRDIRVRPSGNFCHSQMWPVMERAKTRKITLQHQNSMSHSSLPVG